MATTGAARGKVLPRSATITVHNLQPMPCGEVEVTPQGGRVHFRNKDGVDYRLRFWKEHADRNSGIDILLPRNGRATVVIKKDDSFSYSVMPLEDTDEDRAAAGPIKN